MATEDKVLDLVAGQTLPTFQQNNTHAPWRISPYGDQYVMPLGQQRQWLAGETSYYVATNPTPGTGIAGIAATGAFSDAESTLLIKNGNSEGSGKRIYMDYLRVLVTAAGTNGTNHRYVIKLDNSERYTSGGSTITPVNVNMESTSTTGATVYFGALVTTSASSNARLVANGLIRNVITVVGDQYVFEFGGETPSVGALAIAGTSISNVTTRLPPVIIGPGDSMVLSLHAASQTGATSYEFECGWWER